MTQAMKILVVDDNTDAADTTAFVLEAHGFEVQVAYGARRHSLQLAPIVPPSFSSTLVCQLWMDMMWPSLFGLMRP